MIALLCAVSDLLLICAGIFGGSALLMQSPAAGAGDLGRGRLPAVVRIRCVKTAMSSNRSWRAQK